MAARWLKGIAVSSGGGPGGAAAGSWAAGGGLAGGGGAGGEQEGLDGAGGPGGGVGVAEQPAGVVVGEHNAVQVVGELLGVGAGPELALGDAGPEHLGDRVQPVALVLGQAVPHRAGLGVELGAGRDEQAAAGQGLGVPGEPPAEQLPHPRLAPGGGQGGADHQVDEAGPGVVEQLELERLLGMEVGEQPALGQLGRGGQRADGQPAQPDPARHPGRLVQHDLPGLRALAHGADKSTNVRLDQGSVSAGWPGDELDQVVGSSFRPSRIQQAMGSRLPLTSMESRGRAMARCLMASWVVGPRTTWPASATSCSRRAARLTVSPMAVKLRNSSLPMLPMRAGPVLTPTRNRGQSGSRSATASMADCIPRAALAARRAWSGWRAGALNRAMTASPTNCTTVPPLASSTGTARPKYWLSIPTTRSGVVFSENGVNPRRSANSTVTSPTSPPRAAWVGSASRAVATSGDMYWRNSPSSWRYNRAFSSPMDSWLARARSSQRSRSAKGPSARRTSSTPAARSLTVSGRTSRPPRPSVSSTGSSDFSEAPHGSPPSSAGCSPSPSSSGQPSARIEDGKTSCSPSTSPTRSASGRSAWLVSSTPRSSSWRSSRITRASAPTATRARRRWICSRSATSASAARSSTWAWPSVRSKRSARSATTRPTGRAPLPWGACMASTSASRAAACSRRIWEIVSWR